MPDIDSTGRNAFADRLMEAANDVAHGTDHEGDTKNLLREAAARYTSLLADLRQAEVDEQGTFELFTKEQELRIAVELDLSESKDALRRAEQHAEKSREVFSHAVVLLEALQPWAMHGPEVNTLCAQLTLALALLPVLAAEDARG